MSTIHGPFTKASPLFTQPVVDRSRAYIHLPGTATRPRVLAVSALTERGSTIMAKPIVQAVIDARRVRFDGAVTLVPVPTNSRDPGAVHVGGYQRTN